MARNPTASAPQKLKLLIFFTRSYSRAPREREMKALPPTPNRLPTAIRIMKIGVAMDTAFIWYGSWVCPTKTVSTIL